MPVYEYECECGYVCEEYGSIKDGPKSRMKCPNCKKKKLVPTISGGVMSKVEKSDDEVTLGTLAERNSKRMSKEEKEAINAKYKQKKDKLKLGVGMSQMPEYPDPWWRKNQQIPRHKIAKMTPEQQQKYISEGR